MHIKHTKQIITALLVVVLVAAFGIVIFMPPNALPAIADNKPFVPPESPKSTKISLLAVGDNLIHENIYAQAYKRGNGQKYDFGFAYADVEKYLADKNIKFMNQETLICNDIYPPSSYPMFNSPKDLGDHMISLGFNAFSQANNHVLDKGIKGLNACLEYWETKTGPQLVHFGAYRNQQDYEDIRLMTIDRVRFSFVA